MANEEYRYRVVDLDDLQPGPIRHQGLPPSFVVRAQLVHHAFGDAALLGFSAFLENFQRDADPMRELVIWERMASAFLSLASTATTQPERERLAGALLAVSMSWPEVQESAPDGSVLRLAADAFAVAGRMGRAAT